MITARDRSTRIEEMGVRESFARALRADVRGARSGHLCTLLRHGPVHAASWVERGLAVGIIAAQSIGEPGYGKPCRRGVRPQGQAPWQGELHQPAGGPELVGSVRRAQP